MGRTQLDKELTGAGVQDIVAFLGALDGEFRAQAMPRLPATPGGLLNEEWKPCRACL